MLKNENTIFNIVSDDEFNLEALRQFNFQYTHNQVYQSWVNLLKVKPQAVDTIEKIPFLPIGFFKSKQIVSNPIHPQTFCFTSSSTTSQTPSSHFVNDIGIYEQSFTKGFEMVYGSPSDYCILALLPNYLQRKGSSLVYMCKQLIEQSAHQYSGFFLDNINDLLKCISELKQTKQKTLLIGVSYALMDLCDLGLELDDNFIVMETGGMKGRRKELLKEELHQYLKKGFKINTIHSEYGMTELLSQAYSKANGVFECPPWMKIIIREVDDPFKFRYDSKTGGINVIDLANINSCSFIATQDLGRITGNNTFELMGRFDHSDVRGCNLMLGNF